MLNTSPHQHFFLLICKSLLLGNSCLSLMYSGGMNGYLSLCGGDPCPPVFRSPVKGMADIVDNQVM